MFGRIYWSGICYGERMQSISDLTDLLNRYATILNHQFYSDISMGLLLEVNAADLPVLKKALEHLIRFQVQKEEQTVFKENYLVFLSLSFAKGHGDLAFEIPEIPG